MKIKLVIPPPMLQIWHSLPVRRRWQLLILLVMMVVSAFVEVIGLASVLPFLAALTNADKLMAYPYAMAVLAWLEVHEVEQVILLMTMVFIVLSILSGVVRFIVMHVGLRLSYSIGADISQDAYRRTIYQPYRVHADRNSSEVIATVMNKTFTVSLAINSVLQCISSSFIFMTITGFVIWINPLAAGIAITVLGGGYLLMSLVVKERLKLNGKRIAESQTRILKILQESLGGIRDILLDGSQRLYCSLYQASDSHYRQTIGRNAEIALSPRYIMETLGVVLIAGLAYILTQAQGGGAEAIPVLGALALSAQRILPVMNLIYTGWASIKGSYPVIEDVTALLSQPLPVAADQMMSENVTFSDTLTLVDVGFSYHENNHWALSGINLVIPKGARIGFVGKTGSGKSTLIDLIMGLLEPSYGQLKVDGKKIDGGAVRGWQRRIAHVPQSIFLADATIAENIAFGIPVESIDMNQVKVAAQLAQLADYIESLSHGYDTFVGERGIRLSGGQRQRIGIARAMYKQAEVLVFDEATSALDGTTERELMDAIGQLGVNFTVLMVAHRLTTVRDCDFIVVLDAGRIVAQGAYQELLESSDIFRQMAIYNAPQKIEGLV